MNAFRTPCSACLLTTVFASLILSSVQAAQPGTADPLLPGTHKVLVEQRIFGFRRSYYVHVPGTAAARTGPAPVPVVIALHGAFSTARELERDSGLSQLADREGFLVVYPQGFGLGDFLRHWNSGHCCGRARKMNLDDVGFVLSTVDDLAKHNPVDRNRIYVVGFSNGGMLAYRIAAEHPATIAAVAVVSGTIGGTPSANDPEWSVMQPTQPVPVLVIHGRADPNLPYDGGRGPKSHGSGSAISVARSVRFWVDADDCGAEPRIESMDQGFVERQKWNGCRDGTEVVLYSLDHWGHEWPMAGSLGGFDATATIWEFFARHRSITTR